MKTINIYLTKEEQKMCRLLQNKYRVSLSTLADKIGFYTFKYGKKEIIEQYIGKGFKTSIKPKFAEFLKKQSHLDKQINCFFTNAIKIYANKEAKNWIIEENLQKYYTEIDRELQKANDPNWDYNEQLRKLARIAKRNPNYFKKLAGITNEN